MYIKIIGSLIIVAGCGGYGILLAMTHQREVRLLRQLLRVLDVMRSELEYRLTPVPQLCKMSAENVDESLGNVFLEVAYKLERQETVDVAAAVELAVQEQQLPPITAAQLRTLGQTLGRFDLQGQIRGFLQCAQECTQELNKLESNQQQRLRSYQTLGFCAGAALAILLF